MQDFWITRSASWKPSFFTWQLWGLDALPLKTHRKLLVIVPRLNCSIKLLSESDILNCDTATVCDLLKFPDPQILTMLSRSARAETRQSRKEDIKRVMHSVDKVIFKDKKFPSLRLENTKGDSSQEKEFQKLFPSLPPKQNSCSVKPPVVPPRRSQW